MRVLIADDEPLALQQLCEWLEQEPGIELVGAARSGAEVLDLAERLRPDLLVLDIRMPGGDGLSAARTLRASFAPQVVFCTAFSDHAPAAFDLEAVDCLLKPARRDRLREALRRAERRLAAPSAEPPASPAVEHLWIPTANGATRLAVDSIRWIEAAKDYALLHTARRTHILRVTMAELERRLSSHDLLRVHRSAFVRPSAIAAFERRGRRIAAVTLEDGGVVEVAASYALRLERVLTGADV